MMMLLMLFCCCLLEMIRSLRVWRNTRKNRKVCCVLFVRHTPKKAAAMTKKTSTRVVLYESFNEMFEGKVMLLCEQCEVRGTRYLTLTIRERFSICVVLFFFPGLDRMKL